MTTAREWRLTFGVFLAGYIVSSIALGLTLFEVWLPGELVIVAALLFVIGGARLVQLGLRFLDGNA